MVAVSLYLSLHSPYRLKRLRVFDVGNEVEYFDDSFNRDVFLRNVRMSYLPLNKLLLELLEKYDGDFKINLSLSGLAIEHMARYSPELLKSFQELARTGHVEFLLETYYNSPVSAFSKEEFKSQLEMQKTLITKYFGKEPKVFRNVSHMHHAGFSQILDELGVCAILVEGREDFNPHFLYKHPESPNILFLSRSTSLSDDVDKRFSDRNWDGWPLQTKRYAQWVSDVNGNGDVVNLLFSYDSFGLNHAHDSGIFKFFEEFPEHVLSHPDNSFMVASEVLEKFLPKDIPLFHANDMEGVLKSLGVTNNLQKDAMKKFYDLSEHVIRSGDPTLIDDWRKLSSFDHIQFMDTSKFRSGGSISSDVYTSPYDLYLYYINALNDIDYRLKIRKLQSEKDSMIKLASQIHKQAKEEKIQSTTAAVAERN